MINTYNNILINFLSPFHVTYMYENGLIMFVGKDRKGGSVKTIYKSRSQKCKKNVYITKMTLCHENV